MPHKDPNARKATLQRTLDDYLARFSLTNQALAAITPAAAPTRALTCILRAT